MGQGIQRVQFGRGEKTKVYSGVPTQASLKKCPVGMTFHLKEVSVGCDHMIHAIKVGGEVA